jgi:hypothetical protein
VFRQPVGGSVSVLVVGGTDQEECAEAEANDRLQELPTNHSPDFAPVIHPTLETGVETLVTGALAWVSD